MREAKRRPVMMDVAKLAGVSQTTVSLVLNDVPEIRISAEARQRVHDAARTLGYRLSSRDVGRMQAIGMLVDEVSTSPFTVLSIDGARDAAWEANAVLTIASGRGDPAMEAAVLDHWHGQGVSAVIYARIFTCKVTPPRQLDWFRSVLLNCRSDEAMLPAVLPAEQRGGLTATRRLLSAGHQRIGFINGEPWMDAARDRARGYRRALADAAIAYEPDLVRQGNWTRSSGYEETRGLMALSHPPTAIFCGNDRMAAGCYAALKDLGIAIPDGVSVIGYDNQPIAQHLEPLLTSVHLPSVEMGRWAVARLLGPPAAAETVRLDCPLVERESIASPPA
jgi:LacI family transcriptional regulator